MSERDPRQDTPIAVVGVSALFPGSTNARGFWRDILAGRDLIQDVPPSHWRIEDYYDPDPKRPDYTYARRGAFLDKVAFEPMAFGVPPNIIPATDTSQLLALIVAQRVLEDATQGQFAELDRERVSVILGVTSAQELLGAMVSRLQHPVWRKALRETGLPESQVQEACERLSSHYVDWQESTFPGLLGNVVAGRIANRFDLHGTNCVTDAACASTFSALSMAVNELALGHSDMVITGGVDTMNDIFMFMCFSKTTALSLSGDCRPFSDQADGTMLGEGIGMVALRRLEDAERDGDKIYAVLNAVGSSSDGRAKSIYAPVSSGQARALRRAYERAGYGPETVELVEAHGTGTKAGDAAEFEGLRMVFDEADDQRRQWCTLGSVKSQVGHTKSAAGAAGLFKAIMALHHKVLPPTIKIDRPNSLLRLTESPFALSLKARPWIRGSDHPRRASVSSFGFGGTNFHLALEEYTGEGTRAERLRTTPAELVLFGAETPEALIATLRGTEIHGEDCLGWMARHSQENLNPAHPARVAIVAHDDDELTQRLEEAARLIERDPRGQLSSPKGIEYAWQADPGEVAFLFPGQGSQYLHMGAEVAMHFDDALSPWDTAADLHFDDTHRLHDVVFPATAFDDEGRQAQTQRLISTEWAQPAIGATSMSLMTLLSKLGVAPAMVGGHSFGEVTALHAAGALDAATALRVARRRGELMRDAAAQPGAMSAVSATIEKVRPVIDALDGDVVVANHNAPEQVVISGPTDQVSLAEDKLKAAGLRVKRLPVATAFHSSVVSESSAPFAEFLADVEVQTPTLPVYANAQAAPYPAEPQNIRQQLAAQLASPVRFVEQIEAMHDAGARTFVEVGPGSVLTGLTRRILGERPHRAVSVDRKGASGVESFFKAIGALWVAGLTPDFAALWADIAPRQDPRTVQAPRLAVDIDGTNYGKSYPTADDSNLMPPPNPEVEPDVIIKEVEVVKEVPVVQEIVKEVVKEVPVEVRVEVPVPSAAPANGYAPSNPTAAAPLPGAPQAAWSPAAAADHSRMAWLRAYQEVQRQTAEAHAAFQAGMAQSHAAYLQAAEASMHQLGALTQNTAALPAAAPNPWTAAPQGYAQPTAAYAQPSYVAQPQINAQPTTTAPLAAPAPTSVVTPQPAPVATRATSTTASPALNAPATPQATAPVAKAKPTPAPPKAAAKPAPVAKAKPAIDLEALLLNVVADKTGYPADMLSLDMNLEADLGVDSIKRVEILSAMTEQAPGLPEVDTGEMAAMQTLGQIVDYMSALAPQSTAAPQSAPVTSPATASVAPAAASAPAIDLKALLLNVVADKTGYPADMLSLDMDLEADLGVDSIKRVEILSAMTDQAPDLPEVDTGEMAAMQTLGQIVDYMRGQLGDVTGGEPSAATTAANLAPSAASAPSIDLEALLLNVVADKTGYPADMLSLDMNLEADLGVDSIKRVEILSSMTEQAPDLPEVDTGEMAAMQTLGQIVDYMRGQLGGATGGEATQPSTETPQAKPSGPSLGRFVLSLEEVTAPGLTAPSFTKVKRAVVTSDGGGVAEALVARLGQLGVEASISNTPGDADAVFFLGGLKDFEWADAALEIQREAFEFARAAAATMRERGGLFVTVQDTGGDFGTSGDARAWIGGIGGLTKTVAQEWPDATVKALDVERGERDADAVAEIILQECLEGGAELEVAFDAEGTRRVPRSIAQAAVTQGSVAVTPGQVIVVSGGARGVTATTLFALAEAAQPRFVLLGRSPIAQEPASCQGVEDDAGLKRALLNDARARGEKPKPAEIGRQVRRIQAGREIRATLATLKAAGSEARYDAVDVRDAEALSALLEDVRATWGPVAGVIHGAGVLADKLIGDKTDAQFDAVFSTKVAGLRALLAATASDPLSLLVMFSSIAARTGNAGQSDYAMANETLNKVAALEAKRRGDACLVRSLGWGPWEGGMVTPALKARFEALGVALIPHAEGAQMMVDELRGDAQGATEIVLGATPRFRPLLSGDDDRGEAHFDLLVHEVTHPYLADHTVRDVPVVPVVMVMEWFSRAARALAPTLNVVACRDIKVLQGVRLERFSESGDRYQIHCRRISNGTGLVLGLELRGLDGRRHYSATVEMARQAEEAPKVDLSAAPKGLQAWRGPLYNTTTLFHGPDFQVIREMDGVSEEGLSGELEGSAARGWPSDDRWCNDVAALDGGLQMAVLWTHHKLGGDSLPTQVGALRTYSPGFVKGPISCTIQSRRVGRSRIVCDVRLVGADGRLVAEMNDVETHLLPS